ncbi:hypothetical protein Hdeb2414_s0008g00287621 [Helianthus debilis subsp. tardiflorus]
MRIRALEMVSELKERINRFTIICSRTFKSMNSTEEFVIRS